jgi:hypothetical protein
MPLEAFDRKTHLHLLMSGIVCPSDGEAALTYARQTPTEASRLLLDFTEAEELALTVNELVVLAREIMAAVRVVAVAAPRPVIFGLNRQALQLADVGEGSRVRVFRDADTARDWLLSA